MELEPARFRGSAEFIVDMVRAHPELTDEEQVTIVANIIAQIVTDEIKTAPI